MRERGEKEEAVQACCNRKKRLVKMPEKRGNSLTSTFCKKMDKEFKLPMPPKEISKDWDINDWCQYVDATWAERVKKDEESKELPF